MTTPELQPNAAYAAVRENGAGLIDLSDRGRFLITGTEAVQFLNGLITNDMKTLAAGTWMPAAFPNVQGRLIASVRVARLPGEHQPPTFLIDTEPSTREQVMKTIGRFTLAGDFRVTDVTSETAHLAIQGTRARAIASSVIGEDFLELTPRAVASTKFQNTDVTVLRSSHTGADGYDFIIDSSAMPGLLDQLIAAGAQNVDAQTAEVLRIEAGVPKFGADMDDTNVVTETSLDDAVSYTKGCYVGQEIIARIKYRGHVAKKLSGLTFTDRVVVAAGAPIKSADDKDIGRVTSVAYSPTLGCTIALGYLKYDYLTPETDVQVSSEDGFTTARVTELPFIAKPDSEEVLR